MALKAAGRTLNTGLGWLAIIRLGLVQTALGSIVVLTTSTMNRVMVVELALAAIVPGMLVAWHYAIQILRPRMGHGSDVGGCRTPWIIGGMAVLALGGVGAAIATVTIASHPIPGLILAFIGFTLIGIGVGAAGTSLLALLASRVGDTRRAPAATIVWLMMIAGFVVTAILAGHFLDPYSPQRLVVVTGAVALAAFLVATIAISGIEQSSSEVVREAPGPASPGTVTFRQTVAKVWAEPEARRFTIFVFVSMLAYSAQDLILEPFAGLVFGMTPGQSTKLAGTQHAGVLTGMLLVAFAASGRVNGRLGSLRSWMVGGCAASAVALAMIALGGMFASWWPLEAVVFALGFANGAFAVAAIASMMAIAASSRETRPGVRMGVFGAAQGIAFGLGGFVGTIMVDVMRFFLSSPAMAYGAVFVAEALTFLVAAWLATRVAGGERQAVNRTVAADPQSAFAGLS